MSESGAFADGEGPLDGKDEERGKSEARKDPSSEPADGRLFRMGTPAIDESFAELARRGDVEELEDFLLMHAGRLRGFLNARLAAALGGAREVERRLRAAVRHAALEARKAPAPGSEGGIAFWLWRIGLVRVLAELRSRAELDPELEDEIDELEALDGALAWKAFCDAPVQDSPAFVSTLADWSSEEFIHLLKRRDDDAWRSLQEQVRSILRFLMRPRVPSYARSAFDTEDVCQSAMFKVFREIDSLEYRGKDSFHRWLVTVFESRLRDKLRKMGTLKREVAREARLDSSLVDASLFTRPDVLLERAEELATIVSHFSTLPPDTQRLLVMRIHDRLSTREIAFELGISERSVRRRIREAFAELQRRRRQSEEES